MQYTDHKAAFGRIRFAFRPFGLVSTNIHLWKQTITQLTLRGRRQGDGEEGYARELSTAKVARRKLRLAARLVELDFAAHRLTCM